MLLQSATGITKCDSFITKCDRYYKVRQNNPFRTQCVNRIFFESNLFQSEKIKVIYVIDISEYLQQQQQQVVPKEDVLEVAKSPHACK